MTDTERTNGSLLQRRLGDALRQARNAAKVNQTLVARKLRISQDRVSAIERGQKLPTSEQVEIMLVTCDAPQSVRDRVLGLFEEARDAPLAWWDSYNDMYPPKTFQFWPYEDAASLILGSSGPGIPGAAQTPEHAMALAEYYHADENRSYRERFVRARTHRFKLLERGEADVIFVFNESALLAEIGGADVRRGQVRRLIEIADLPRLTIRIIPLSSPFSALAASSFTYLDFPSEEDPPIVFTSVARQSFFVDDSKSVESELRRFRVLESAALPKEASLELMKKVA